MRLNVDIRFPDITVAAKPVTDDVLNLLLADINRRMARVEAKLDRVLNRQEQEMITMQDVLNDENEIKDVLTAFIAEYQAAKDQLATGGVPQAQIDEAFAGLEAIKAQITAASAPSAPAPEPQPEPPAEPPTA